MLVVILVLLRQPQQHSFVSVVVVCESIFSMASQRASRQRLVSMRVDPN